MACQDLIELEKTTSKQIAALKKELEEKSEALKDMENQNSCLTVKQVLTNQELQDARKESIRVFFMFSFASSYVSSSKSGLNLKVLNPRLLWFLMCRA